ncbi:MAG: hypothetical protein ACI9G1_001664, partial [Pirellulaceae bacterium]
MGEVEDYKISISSPSQATGVFGSQNVISTSVNFATDVYVDDVDGDAFPDVITTSSFDDSVRVFSGGTEIIVDTNVPAASSVVVADLDGDFIRDIIVSSAQDDSIYWYDFVAPNTFNRIAIAIEVDGAA